MEKEKVIETMMVNPKYSSDQISDMATAVAEWGGDYDKLILYPAETLRAVIGVAKGWKDSNVKLGSDSDNSELHYLKAAMEIFPSNAGFNPTQITILGMLMPKVDRGVFVKYCDPKIPYGHIHYILTAVSEGYTAMDNTKYLNYKADQLAEIYGGFKSKVDVSQYDNPSIPGKTMQLIRHALEIGYKKISYNADENKLTIE